MKRLSPLVPLTLLAACATTPRPPAQPQGPVEVQILGLNDFHGNLQPPKSAIDAMLADGTPVKVPAGGAAYLASAAKALRVAPRACSMSASSFMETTISAAIARRQ